MQANSNSSDNMNVTNDDRLSQSTVYADAYKESIKSISNIGYKELAITEHLTARHRAILAHLDDDIVDDTSDKDKIHNDPLLNAMQPDCRPSSIVRMFQEERQRVVRRRLECKRLLDEANSALDVIDNHRNLYLHVAPKTKQLHTECRLITQERDKLKKEYDMINSYLNQANQEIAQPDTSCVVS